MKLAKKYRDRIADEFSEDGTYWIHLKRGWKDASDPLGCVHGIHEDTKQEAYRALRDSEPCNCRDCTYLPEPIFG